jgi:hypothetical protein
LESSPQKRTDNVKPLSRQQIEKMLNDCKYDLMALNQSLSIVGTASKLAEELLSSRAAIQQKIEKLEADLRKLNSAPPAEEAKGVKKVVNQDGEVRIWASGS